MNFTNFANGPLHASLDHYLKCDEGGREWLISTLRSNGQEPRAWALTLCGAAAAGPTSIELAMIRAIPQSEAGALYEHLADLRDTELRDIQIPAVLAMTGRLDLATPWYGAMDAERPRWDANVSIYAAGLTIPGGGEMALGQSPRRLAQIAGMLQHLRDQGFSMVAIAQAGADARASDATANRLHLALAFQQSGDLDLMQGMATALVSREDVLPKELSVLRSYLVWKCKQMVLKQPATVAA